MSRDERYDTGEPYVVIEERRGTGAAPFLLGLAIGAGLALLYAPRSGAETRTELKRRAGHAKRLAREAAEDLSDSVADRYEQAKRTVEDRIDSARRTLDMRKRQATEAIRAGREAAQQARQDLEARIAETKASYRGGEGTRAARRTTATAGDDVQDAADRELPEE